MAFHHAKGLPVVVLRCATLVGGAERPDALVRRIVESAMAGKIVLDGDGSQTRDLCDVSDAVEVVVRALTAQAGETYNISGGVTVPIAMLAEFVAREVAAKTGTRVEITKGPARPHEEGPLALDLSKAMAAKLLPPSMVPWPVAVRHTITWCSEQRSAT